MILNMSKYSKDIIFAINLNELYRKSFKGNYICCYLEAQRKSIEITQEAN